MSYWRVTVKPREDTAAWETFLAQGIIGIGYAKDAPEVRRFMQIRPGDYVIAHVPESHGGGRCLVRAVGLVTGEYQVVMRHELPPGDSWDGNVRRQVPVQWLRVQDHCMRGAFGYWRGVVHMLGPECERIVRQLFQL